MKSINNFIVETELKDTKAKTWLGVKSGEYIYKIDKNYNIEEIKVIDIKDKQKIAGRYWETLVLEDQTELFVQANSSFWWKDEDPNTFIVYTVTPDIKNDKKYSFINFWFKSH